MLGQPGLGGTGCCDAAFPLENPPPHNRNTMLVLLKTFSWQEALHHPTRSLAALLAVAAGVALAFSVHLINNSAVDEFSSAARGLNGQPDLVLRASQATFEEQWLERIGRHPAVALASPVLEIQTYALRPNQRKASAQAPGRDETEDRGSVPARRVALRVLGVDGLVVAAAAPALAPRPFPSSGRLSLRSRTR